MSPLKPSVVRFKFDNFAKFPSKPGIRSIFSEPVMDCHGHAWAVFLQLGGALDSVVGEDTYVKVYLTLLGADSITAKSSFILRDARGEVFKEKSMRPVRFEASGPSMGGDFVRRSSVLDKANDVLVDGALLIDVHLQFMPQDDCLCIPSNSLSRKMLKFLENDEGDVSFKVGDAVITAHKLILKMNSWDLFNFCNEKDGASPIPINGTTPEIFRVILRYAYGEEIPDATTIIARGKEIIDAADRFGVVDLKLRVEATLVESLVMDVNNVADWLAFADAKTCALLKEQAIAYFASRSDDILKSETSKILKESPRLLTELILEVSRSANGDVRFGGGRDVSVGDLRKRLREKGLDVDGSKEMLVSRLQESNEESDEESNKESNKRQRVE